jgi:hypothetical protein
MLQETTMFFPKHSFLQVLMMDEFFLNALLVDITSNLTASGGCDGMTASYICQGILSEIRDRNKFHPLGPRGWNVRYAFYTLITAGL